MRRIIFDRCYAASSIYGVSEDRTVIACSCTNVDGVTAERRIESSSPFGMLGGLPVVNPLPGVEPNQYIIVDVDGISIG
jgi:hypothetical protein